ncbi:MAG: substrate-binding domain-containing protein [Lapillicoccus sp.]
MHRLGLDVPGDVSVVGFDDQPDVANEIRPALTTVALPYYEMGFRAGQLLAEHPTPSSSDITVPCPLVIRDSLGPPPTR